MKKSFVFVAAIFIVLFILNSFVLKEKEAGEKTTEGTKSFTGVTRHDKSLKDPIAKVPLAKVNRKKSGLVKIVFKSTDGGQTWQDISEGLPENLKGEGVQRDGFFANDRGLYLRAGNGIYHVEPNSKTPIWKKEIFPDKRRSIAPGKAGIFAYNYEGQFLQKTKGTSTWLPVYTNFQGKEVRTVFETAGGTVFIGSNNRLFKSTNRGKTWKPLRTGGWIMKMVESNGVLLAAGQEGILRSIDDGENWKWVIKEGGVGIAVERIRGGFAAISYNTEAKSRRIHISVDKGKTWQAIDEGLPRSLSISSIKQMGKYLIIGHPDGIFRSSDMGKIWKSVLPGVDKHSSADKNVFKFVTTWASPVSEPGNVFRVYTSGNVVYAVAGNAGC